MVDYVYDYGYDYDYDFRCSLFLDDYNNDDDVDHNDHKTWRFTLINFENIQKPPHHQKGKKNSR